MQFLYIRYHILLGVSQKKEVTFELTLQAYSIPLDYIILSEISFFCPSLLGSAAPSDQNL